MAYAPISLITPQFEDYPNYWLKAYSEGTTTPLAMATDSTGTTTATKFQLNASGFPVTAGGAMIIPYINGDYDLWLFPTAAEADANDTTNALQMADDVNADPNVNDVTTITMVDTLEAAIATTTLSGSIYILGRTTNLDGYEGTFVWDSTDRSAEVTSDTQQGVWIAPLSDPTGSSGAWGREYYGLPNVKWFGDTSGNCATAFSGADNFGTFLVPEGTYVFSGNVTLTSNIVFHPEAYLSPSTGFTVTINGKITPPPSGNPFIGDGDVVIGDVFVTVPTDYATIQEAVDNCPKRLWQTYTIDIESGTYAEDVKVEGITSEKTVRGSVTGKKSRLLVRGANGVSQDPNVRVKSITAINCSGTNNNPTIYQFTLYDDNGYTPGPPAAYAAYQCGETEVNDVSFDGDGILYCINSYSSRVNVKDTFFGTSVNQYAGLTKHGGILTMQTGNTGVLTDYAVRPENGIILCHELAALRGEQGLVIRTEDTSGVDGLVFDSASHQIWGANNFASTLGSNFHTYFESLDGFTTTLSGGTATLSSGGVYLSTGAGSGNYAGISMIRTPLLSASSNWESVYRDFSVAISRSADTVSTWYAIIGSLAGTYIGFKYDSTAGLYGVAYNSVAETTVLLTAAPATVLSLVCKVYASSVGHYVDFYVGSNYAGTLTTGLPTGNPGNILFHVQIEADEAVDKALFLGELAFNKSS